MNLMLEKALRRSFVFVALLVCSAAAVSAQSVYTRPATPSASPTATPLVKPIVKVQPPTLTTQPSLPRPNATTTTNVATVPAPANSAAADIVNPLVEPEVGGMRGVLVETQNGQLVMDNMSNMTFNPASNIKLATALAVLKTYKANYRFKTQIYTTGIVDTTTGTITGDLVIVGNDPSLQYEHAVAIADALNKIGIRQVNGDLIVSPTFTINYNPSAVRSGVMFYDTLDAARRSAAAMRSWQNHVAASKPGQPTPIPSVAIMGAVTADGVPTNLRPLVTFESSPLKDILKACLSYSNNFLAERFGDLVGGPEGVERIIQEEAKVPYEEFQIASTSGLGINRVTPRAMMKIFRALHNEMAKNKILPTDIMPVAGVDEGTLKNRFGYKGRGSVIGKTGTLPNTDSGVSSLVGQMATASGEVLFFVIFNQRGNVSRFRSYQDQLVNYLQATRGGAANFSYLPKSFATLLANTRISTDKSLNGNRNEE